MSIGRILTLGLGSFGDHTLVTLGYSPGAAPAPVVTATTVGADDEPSWDVIYRQRKLRDDQDVLAVIKRFLQVH